MTVYAIAVAFAAILATFAIVSIRRAGERNAWRAGTPDRRHRLRGWWRR